MYCIEEITCDIVGTFRRLTQWFGAPIVIRRPGIWPPSLPPEEIHCPNASKFHAATFEAAQIVFSEKKLFENNPRHLRQKCQKKNYIHEHHHNLILKKIIS